MSVNKQVGISDFNLTPRAKKAYKAAKDSATGLGHSTTNNVHVFLGCLMNAPDSFWNHLKSNEIEIRLESVEDIIASYSDSNPEFFFTDDSWHPEVKKTMQVAHDLSEAQEQYYIGIEHILCAILETSEDICAYLNGSAIDALYLRDIIFLAMNEGYSVDGESIEGEEEISLGLENIDSAHRVLSRFSTSLNLNYIAGRLPEVHGRDAEIDKAVEILGRKNKCNVILIGEPGVGKTAIAEGLTRKIIDAQVPMSLLGHEVFLVDMGAMISGTRYRGEFEERFHAFIKAAESIPNCVLFFDEIHTLLGTGGGGEGTLDASNMLKPALARGTIKCIGATTLKDYKKTFEKDGALKRRFQPLEIGEPDVDQMKDIVSNCIGKYEEFHGVKYSSEILDLAVGLCDRYLPHLNFPDKAFDIIDLVGARTKTRKTFLPETLLKKHQELTALVNKNKGSLDVEGGEGEELLKDYTSGMHDLYERFSRSKITVKQKDIVDIVAERAGIDSKSISTSGGVVLEFLDKMKSEVFGQDPVLEEIDDILICSKAQLNDDGKPLASLLFVGPTSVGKTFTSKKIAEHFLGNKESFLHINMGEFMEKGSINKLIGTSSGFIGYEEGGLLTDFLSKRPVSVVLFDEIEKAHPKVLDILLSLLEEATITDNTNTVINCSKAIFVMTTNIGHAERTAAANQIGFGSDENEPPKDTYLKTVKKTLRPELVARLDAMLAFEDLGDAELEEIIKTEIGKIRVGLKKQGVRLSCGSPVVKLILDKVKGNKLHARDIVGLVKKEIKVPVSRNLLSRVKTSKITVKALDKGAKIDIIGV